LGAKLSFDLTGRDHAGAKPGDELREGLGQIAVRVGQRPNRFPSSDTFSADEN